MRPSRAPDWRNLGVVLRTVLLVNALAALALLARNRSWDALLLDAMEMAARVEPALLMSLLLLYLAAPLFARLPVRAGWALVALCALVCTLLAEAMTGWAIEDMKAWPVREALWALLASAAAMVYFTVQERALGPAIAQARLMALSARIRPHFLFNSLNAVLGIMREDPRRAERALEELSDLFRVLMRENRELVTLGEELALCRQYIELEKLRLGDRLGVVWQGVRDPTPPAHWRCRCDKPGGNAGKKHPDAHENSCGHTGHHLSGLWLTSSFPGNPWKKKAGRHHPALKIWSDPKLT